MNSVITRSNGDAQASPGSCERAKLMLDGVCQVFDTPDGGPHLVLDDVDLRVKPGEFVCLVGASGCGKTTLLRIMGGLTRPSAGRVRLDGEEVSRPTRTCGFVFQHDSLMPWRTVNGNVGLGLELGGVAADRRRELVAASLRMVGLERWGKHFPRELSGGMRQRVNLARALAIQPTILLMDEPFAALDAQTREVLQDELLSLYERLGATVVFVTHQVEEAVLLADRIVVLSASPGRIKDIVVPPFTRPRRHEIKRKPEFARCVDDVWNLIESEVRTGVERELRRGG